MKQYTYLFGPRIYPMGHHTITPFVHALFGDSHVSIPALPLSDDAFGWAVGGGIDYSVGEHIAIRLGEVDFEQARNNVGSDQQNNFKYKAGIVFRF